MTDQDQDQDQDRKGIFDFAIKRSAKMLDGIND